MIIDRRSDSKHKSSVNRSRFIQRFKGQIKKAVSDTINKDSIKDLAGKKIGISNRSIKEPRFRTGPGGISEDVHPGNDKYHSGEEVERPYGDDGMGSSASPDGEGMDEFVFTLSREEFLDIFFEELALPNLTKKYLASLKEFKRVRAGISNAGTPNNINLVRTFRSATGRRVAIGGPYATELAELEEKLAEVTDEEEFTFLTEEIERVRTRISHIPWIDTFDLRYNYHDKVPQPSAQAVMFCLMDVSGSMDEEKKNIAKRFFTLLYLFLTRTYEKTDIVFIRHHVHAEEVDEDTFFHSQETGGTIVSSALKLMLQIIEERYNNGQWNIYGAQASDGDNWFEDSNGCIQLLEDQILKLVQYFAYVEIAERPQSLWVEYESITPKYEGLFAIRRINSAADIYPVFCDLFKKHE
jgi:hypothetical protein